MTRARKGSERSNMAEPSDKTTTLSSVRRGGWLQPLVRFAAWWFSLFALLGPLSVCPVCGQSGCPGGAASAGILGGVMAAFISALRWICDSVRHRRSIKATCASKEAKEAVDRSPCRDTEV